jgi:hypothetical protein
MGGGLLNQSATSSKQPQGLQQVQMMQMGDN